MDTSNCKNCGTNIEAANYCPHCGQSAKIQKINLSYLANNLIYSLFHVDKGIFYTMKELTFRPAKTIGEYLEGKRVNQFKPFSYLFIIAAVYVFLYMNLDLPFYPSHSYSEVDPDIHRLNALGEVFANWVITHMGIVQLVLIPLSALLSFLLFRKSRYNYGENLIINTYASGHAILFSIVFLPFLYLMNRWGFGEFVVFFPLSFIIQIIIICSVFNMYSMASRIVRSILWMALQYLILVIILTTLLMTTFFFFQ